MAAAHGYKPRALWWGDPTRRSYFPFAVQEARSDILFAMGEWARAERVYDACRERAAAFGMADKKAHYDGTLGWLHFNTGRDETARGLIDGAVGHFTATGNKKELGKALNYLGSLHWRRGEYAKAIECFQRDLEISTEIGDQDGINSTTGNLGIVYNDMGDLDRAMEYYRRQEALSIEQNNRASLATAVGNMASVYLEWGDYARAEQCGKQQLLIYQQLGEKQGIGIACNNIGTVCLLRGEYGAARDCFERQRRISEEIGDRMLLSIAWGDLGQVHAAQQDLHEASVLFDRAIAAQRELELKYYLCHYLQQKAELLSREGAIGEARAANAEARAVAQEVGRRDVAFDADLLDARLTALSDPSRAIAALQAMISGQLEPQRRAAILYALFPLTKDPAHQQAACGLYRDLYQQTPNILYQSRAGELS
ncbi:MAG TPA: tetratricopeptide repeat protein [Candidatus Edwardsbacteria bacterium]|nr:tetratricopeptide repeat protein [Candidatus Edwardsbacteria bacterium]